jgi:hypothetical protein
MKIIVTYSELFSVESSGGLRGERSATSIVVAVNRIVPGLAYTVNCGNIVFIASPK